jgi:hypothetical protein
VTDNDNVINFKFRQNVTSPHIGSIADILRNCADSEHIEMATGFVLMLDCPDGVKGTAVNVTNGDMLWLAENLRNMAIGKDFG